ncbi:MAG: HAD family hydrolase [Clostridia bacterium]|nr:HAD family hydrolase [Clostridia bacterium]
MNGKSTNLVLDFDGTMVKLFARYNLSKITERLASEMEKFGISLDKGLDPFDVFSEISKQVDSGDEKIIAYTKAHKILTEAETEAVKTCEPICGIDEIFPLLCKNYNVGIATNNSEECVKIFLSERYSDINVSIVGRVGSAPERMKPNIWPLVTVAGRLGCRLEDIVFIGDASTDYLCAKNAGCAFLGIAHSPYKRERLSEFLPPEHIAENYYQLSSMLKSLI